MQVRHAIVAVTIAAFALSLSACTTGTPAPTGDTTAPTTTASPTAAPTTAPTSGATQPTGKIRSITAGFQLAGTADSLRTGFPSFAPYSDKEIEAILNAGCDGIDATGSPTGGADAIAAQGVDKADAAFGTLAAIQLYCPEYKKFLGGSTTG